MFLPVCVSSPDTADLVISYYHNLYLFTIIGLINPCTSQPQLPITPNVSHPIDCIKDNLYLFPAYYDLSLNIYVIYNYLTRRGFLYHLINENLKVEHIVSHIQFRFRRIEEMDILSRIMQMRLDRGWSEYELAKRSGITQSTISSWYSKEAQPTVKSIESICKGFGITMSQFFLEKDSGDPTVLNRQQLRLIDYACRLDPDQIDSLMDFLEKLHPTASINADK